jgi:catechol 2,3-dioxygenase-like lactoylglutathione lyase family enzyme
MPEEAFNAQLDHIHLYVENIEVFQTLFERLFSMKTINHTFVGAKEILRIDLSGSNIILTPASEGHRTGIDHLGISTNEFDRVSEGLIEAGWSVTETQIDNALRKYFLRSPEGILIELMEKR